MTELKFARDGDAEKAGVAEMTLDEINAEIAAVRSLPGEAESLSRRSSEEKA